MNEKKFIIIQNYFTKEWSAEEVIREDDDYYYCYETSPYCCGSEECGTSKNSINKIYNNINDAEKDLIKKTNEYTSNPRMAKRG